MTFELLNNSTESMFGTMPQNLTGESNLLNRWTPLADNQQCRDDHGQHVCLQVNLGGNGTRGIGRTSFGETYFGVQFAVQDHLSLSSHPAICAAAKAAIRSWGVHSAGSTVQMGLSDSVERLEARVAHFVSLAEATVFPTGWAARYGAIRTLVRPGDHVLIDARAHTSLHEGATAATRHVQSLPNLSPKILMQRLGLLHGKAPEAGILVVTEGRFASDGTSPDLVALQALCRQHGATLLVDVSQDLGVSGPAGRGQLGVQGMLGRIDVVTGSFSRCFASNGGFVAANHPALKQALRQSCGPQTFSNTLSPVQTATVLAAFDIIDSAEGEALRQRLMRNVCAMRQGLTDAGYSLPGPPGAIVPVGLGEISRARWMTSEMLRFGVFVNLIEDAQHGCQWQLLAMAAHDSHDLEHLCDTAAYVLQSCKM